MVIVQLRHEHCGVTLHLLLKEERIENASRKGCHKVRRCDAPQEDIVNPAPLEVHPSIANLRGSHRAAHPNEGTILEAASHLHMANEWHVQCPHFIDALEHAGIACIRHLQFIKLDHHLITALVERWCPQTNTFHLPVGEMTITLQDVQIILGVRIDGPALVGPIVVGLGRKWSSWSDCCDELLGSHPERDVVYQHPNKDNLSSKFRMGSAQAQTCIPLRWLRWTFARESYMDLTMDDLFRHVRAYILYMLGCFLLPDTSGSHLHLQFLPLLADLGEFSQYSLGGSILAHLYRELNEATKPTRATMAGCLHLLQVWSWERLHVGRPTLYVPFPRDIIGKPLGYRWNEERVREVPIGNVRMYRDEIDGLQQSQVIWEPYTPELMIWLPEICVEGKEIWHARIPLISWKRVEWHMPDRVMRQFGGRQTIELEPMEHAFRRVDGRGRADVDWMNYHRNYIEMWNNRRAYIIEVTPHGDDQQELLRYMHWYKSWASLYLLKAPTTPPDTYYPRSSIERILVDYYVQSKGILHPFFGGHGNDASAMQLAMDEVASLCSRVESSIHIDFSAVKKPNTHKGTSQSSVVGVGPSKARDHEPFTPANPRPSAYMDPRPSMIPNTRPPGTVPCNQLWPSFDLNSSASKGGQLSSYLQVPFTMTPYNMTVPFWMPPTAVLRLPAYPNHFCMPLKQHPYYMEQTTNASTSAQADVKVEDTVEEHQLQACPLRGLEKCTPESDAIPHKRRRRRNVKLL